MCNKENSTLQLYKYNRNQFIAEGDWFDKSKFKFRKLSGGSLELNGVKFDKETILDLIKTLQKAYEMKELQTTCPYCNNLLIELEGEIGKTNGDEIING